MWIFCARIQNRALEGKDSPVSGEHTLVLLHYQPSISTSSLENIRLRKKYKGGEDALNGGWELFCLQDTACRCRLTEPLTWLHSAVWGICTTAQYMYVVLVAKVAQKAGPRKTYTVLFCVATVFLPNAFVIQVLKMKLSLPNTVQLLLPFYTLFLISKLPRNSKRERTLFATWMHRSFSCLFD